ncbi:MAG: hypothetical protein IIT60_01760, partial [Muribaculaceae bacterium]|nr:hypothetical protein [Muribaculaceae bacterium]
ELVNRIQNVRKSKNFDITDKIVVRINPDERVNEAVEQFKDYIARQVLAVSIELESLPDAPERVELDMDEYMLYVTVDKA